jgi:TusA-related sulfurtransferase
LVNDSPYEQGWFVTIYPTNLENELKYLKNANDCREQLKIIIEDLNVRCFKYFPDYELYEIGSECVATLMKLDDLLSRIKVGEIVYLVSDDVTADIELQRWSMENSQSVVDIRKEKNLFHFLIRKEKDI